MTIPGGALDSVHVLQGSAFMMSDLAGDIRDESISGLFHGVQNGLQRIATLQWDQRVLGELQLQNAQRGDDVVPLRARLTPPNTRNDLPVMLDLALAEGKELAAVQIILRQR